MPANTGDNVILDLGMRVDSTGAQADMQDIVDYFQDIIKDNFNIDIKANNLNELRQQLNNLGGSLTIVKDDATGMTTAIQASFKTANGEAVKLRAAVEAVNGQYQLAANTDVSARVVAGTNKLQKLEEQLVQAMEKRTQAAKDFDANTINSSEKRIKQLQSEIAQQKELLKVLQNQGTTAANVIKQRKDAAYTGLTGQLGISTAQSKTAQGKYTEFAKNIDAATLSLKELKKAQLEAINASNMDKSSQTWQDIQSRVSALIPEVQRYVDIINAAGGKVTFDHTADTINSLTSSYTGQNKALKEMSNLINSIGKAWTTAKAKMSDQQNDTQKIQAAVKAYQQYRDAVLVVDKAKASGRTATQQETAAVNQAKAAYEQCEQAILSNGEAVQQNTTYNREKNQITRNSIQALKEYESQLGSVNNSMAGSIAQMIQMKLGFEGLQEAIRKVYETAKDLNDSMTDIQLVTQQSNSDATDLMKSYAGLAQEMGTTTAEVAASADEWLSV